MKAYARTHRHTNRTKQALCLHSTERAQRYSEVQGDLPFMEPWRRRRLAASGRMHLGSYFMLIFSSDISTGERRRNEPAFDYTAESALHRLQWTFDNWNESSKQSWEDMSHTHNRFSRIAVWLIKLLAIISVKSKKVTFVSWLSATRLPSYELSKLLFTNYSVVEISGKKIKEMLISRQSDLYVQIVAHYMKFCPFLSLL